jgi:hypothetical protein
VTIWTWLTLGDVTESARNNCRPETGGVRGDGYGGMRPRGRIMSLLESAMYTHSSRL